MSEVTATPSERVKNLARRVVCWWRGHTYRANGTFSNPLHAVMDQKCIRCGIAYLDWFNNGGRP